MWVLRERETRPLPRARPGPLCVLWETSETPRVKTLCHECFLDVGGHSQAEKVISKALGLLGCSFSISLKNIFYIFF